MLNLYGAEISWKILLVLPIARNEADLANGNVHEMDSEGMLGQGVQPDNWLALTAPKSPCP